ncbi:uncharacterized protein LOC121602480 [Anopheles merus]|uniref:uncharacterized protein LOC121602480 n=1 Tax=Anopheles merus TaxID=30066 RepID=UPI001BE49FAF|nr:uncharacterized protein LOC121602480 [Anopheles merus]
MKGFLRRHREIAIRTPETVSSASAKVCEADIRGWFANLTSYLEENNLIEATLDPTRIYNGDETSFFLHPQTKAVFANRGSKNVYECEHADSHKNITVMFTFGADADIIDPCVMLPMKRIPADILREFPANWGVGKSEKGWMDTPGFMLYIRELFYPHLLKKKVKFPVLLFVDGQSSHTAAEVAELCLKLGIVLIALYPNTTRITQPADVAIFKPLKSAWKSAVSNWRMENGGVNLLIKHFSSVLQEAMEKGIQPASIKNGFKVCGLFPFGPDNVDYDKCIARLVKQSEVNTTESTIMDPASCSAEMPSELIASLNPGTVVISTEKNQAAIQCIGRERIMKFNEGLVDSEEDEIIERLYEIMLLPFDSQNMQSASELMQEAYSGSTILKEESVFVEEIGYCLLEEQSEASQNILREPNRDDVACRKMSISELLQTPPTPHRSNTHRNFKKKISPSFDGIRPAGRNLPH